MALGPSRSFTTPDTTLSAALRYPAITPMETPMTYACEDSLVMLAEMTLQPGKRDAFLDYTAANLALSRDAKGNLAFDILLDEAAPDRVVFYEEWDSAEAQQAYMAWRIERGDLTVLMSFLAAEPKFTALRRIAT